MDAGWDIDKRRGSEQGPTMGEIINLRRARKARARDDASAQAAANRAAHGRSKAQKAADGEAKIRRDALLDGARRTTAHGAEPDDGP